MATLANIFNVFIGSATEAKAAAHTAERNRGDAYKLRALPNEDVFFFTKRIDNSRVVRQPDPRANARDWRLVGGASFTAASLIAILLPSAYGLIAGYQLSGLQQQQQQLINERARLELEEARLISTERLEEIARSSEFVDPSTDATVYLAPTREKALAAQIRQ